MDRSGVPAGADKDGVFRRLWRWFSQLELFTKCVLAFVAFVLMAVLFFAEENWRGKWQWEACRRDLITRGVELDWHKFAPPPVPDDQNFAMTPFLAPLLDLNPRPRDPGQSPWRNVEGRDRVVNFANAFKVTNNLGDTSIFIEGKLTDFEQALDLMQTNSSSAAPVFTSRVEAATAVLSAFEEFEPVLAELRTASRRRHARFNLEYDSDDPVTVLLPHLAVLRRINRIAGIRAAAELALGKRDAAVEDIKFMIYLANAIREEPFLACRNVRTSMLLNSAQAIWEGLATQGWTDAQLQEIQKQIAEFKLLEELERSLACERAAFGVGVLDYARRHPNGLREWAAWDEKMTPIIYILAGPAGWLDMEQVSCQKMYDELVFPGIVPRDGRIHPQIIAENTREVEQRGTNTFANLWHHTTFSRLLTPRMLVFGQRTAFAQTRADQAAVACALERFRTARGKYPEKLDELMPIFLEKVPQDICGSGPVKYRRTENEQFVLYSVGWNEIDDGGKIVNKNAGEDAGPDISQGDWVWPSYSFVRH